MNIEYLVYKGDDLCGSYKDIEKAKKFYNELPSGKGKPWHNRRRLVKEELIIEDSRK
tara:strand:+ start:979 stop:1149 length:171 start_codon:yes stop_codon:yes gene_type:complete